MASEIETAIAPSASAEGQKHGEGLENNNSIVGNVEMGSSTSDSRIKRKAKRRIKRSPSTEMQQINGTVQVQRNTKNMRKSRMGKGRGQPKKGGAGGKGTWGTPGSELLEDGMCNDEKDPNYDSDTRENYFTSVVPAIHEDEFEKVVEPILQEYFEHGDTDEVAECLNELNIKHIRHGVPKLAVTIALERKAAQREMTSVLISDLYGKKLVNEDEVATAFNDVLNELEDLSLDTPDAPQVVGQFIARAVADDCLPPKFVQSHRGSAESEKPKSDEDSSEMSAEQLKKHALCRTALDRASVLLSMKHGMVRLDNVWGVSGGIKPVKSLIKKMVLLLKEYLSSGDTEEAVRCLQELEVPHFHHEVVYEAIVMVIEDMGERSAQMMAKLLKSFYDSTVITWDQLVRGFERVFNSMPDISLDVPSAYALLERLADLCVVEGLMSEKMRNRVPSRGRKRFVSEGDGGKVKENSH
ncbi:programmed cell death protein 4-like [Saccoglossus kowalevskii]|uniref:Programmed cell death protein 4-like n=1 Tax=Saccoglossus kowalevskii TaxID=10224 RepID=A0ABM0MCZ3_SACKO|nr:PREDICTED: programmed cell death protein 4-like [Saccoglossus kowalevskii]